ncbi:MAG: hypothetical protein JRJ85_14380 [Deltaproteobacteria bacterium]|nr:hypothetical protein [Deltaproteobacteria bacterium]
MSFLFANLALIVKTAQGIPQIPAGPVQTLCKKVVQDFLNDLFIEAIIRMVN